MQNISVKKIVKEYYGSHLFAFLPNICNSSCEFCYVSPIVGKRAKLNKETLSNFDKLCQQSKNLGFETIRITGGEPLLFINFGLIIKTLKKYSLSYTIMTNGAFFKDFMDDFSNYPPSKISLSFHSEDNYESIFKSKINIDELKEQLIRFSQLKIKRNITIVFLDKNLNEINKLVKSFEIKYADSFKIILPNVSSQDDNTINKFINQSRTYFSPLELRITDLSQKQCMLKSRGFLSIVVENYIGYNCCTTIGESKSAYKIEENLREILLKQYEDNIHIENFPCKSHIKSCPIALREV